ncbi:MAG: hypothetical protein U9O98_06330 [Asgard group archaeon]|nr:hypothetical protein [Asgard group archaeon]
MVGPKINKKKSTLKKKDITIRGVNKDLYEQFITFARRIGFSAGEAFDELVFTLLYKPWRHITPMPEGLVEEPPEIIEKLDHLKVTKKDLLEAGEEVQYLFRDINELIFDKSVTGEIVIKHVRMIIKCDVTFQGPVSRFIQSGILRKRPEYHHPTDESKLKDVTIRNVSTEIYDEFLAVAKQRGKTTGEFFSDLLASSIPRIEIYRHTHHRPAMKGNLVILFENNLTVTKEDLELLKKRQVVFYGIDKLVFTKDITQELFMKTVDKIIKCDTVILPKTIPRLIVLSRAVDCSSVKTS